MSSLKTPLLYTIISIVGSLLPLLAAFLLMLIFEEKVLTLLDITGKGELTIICIPLSISIVFSLYTYKRSGGFSSWPDIIFTLTSLFLILSVVVYGYGYNRLSGPKSGLMIFSLIFLVWTIIAMFSAKYHEEYADSVKSARKTDQDNLENKFKNKK